MKIVDIKKIAKGKYKLTFDNKDNVTLYEDVIIDNTLLLNKNIDNSLLQKVSKENYYATAYNQALSYINVRLRSETEIRSYLEKKQYDQELIDKVVNQLLHEDYLNDYNFVTAFINDKLYLSNDGPYKIKKALGNYRVDETIIDEALSKIDEKSWQDKLQKLIKKQLGLNKKYKGYLLKQKLSQYFFNLGYDSDMIREGLEKANITNNDNSEYVD